MNEQARNVIPEAVLLRALHDKLLDSLLAAIRLCLVGVLTDTDRADCKALRELQAAVEHVLAERRGMQGPPPEKPREGGAERA